MRAKADVWQFGERTEEHSFSLGKQDSDEVVFELKYK